MRIWAALIGPIPCNASRSGANEREKLRFELLCLGAQGGGEFLYLATVLDCFSRKVVGWSIADHMRADLVTDALRMAARTRGSLEGSVFHSDHGAQYGSRAYANLCNRLKVTRSMGYQVDGCGRHECGQRGL